MLPDRRGPEDFFVCDVFDAAAPKGDIASMEHPVYSLSTKPDYRIRKYEHNGNFIEVKPSSDGLATVHDRDVLIYCVSQLIRAMNAGRPVAQVVRFTAHDLLKATNRMTNGQGYEALKAAFDRLADWVADREQSVFVPRTLIPALLLPSRIALDQSQSDLRSRQNSGTSAFEATLKRKTGLLEGKPVFIL